MTRPRITDGQALALLGADGPELEALAALADSMRRDAVGDDITYVVTRNINFTNVCYTGCRFCAFAQRRTDADAYTLSLEQVGDRAAEAWPAGATEMCMQGGIHPDLPGTAYFDIAAEMKRTQPGYSPARVLADGGGQRRSPDRRLGVQEWLAGAKAGRRRLAPRNRGRDPRRRRAVDADEGQAAGLRLDRGRPHRTPAGHPVDRHDDVRARRHARALGRAPPGDPRHPGRDRWVHRVRAAPVRARRVRRSTWRAWPGRVRPGGRTGRSTRCRG